MKLSTCSQGRGRVWGSLCGPYERESNKIKARTARVSIENVVLTWQSEAGHQIVVHVDVDHADRFFDSTVLSSLTSSSNGYTSHGGWSQSKSRQ